jgi:hypothetical protein
MRRVRPTIPGLLSALLLSACANDALTVGDPGSLTLVLDRPYIDVVEGEAVDYLEREVIAEIGEADNPDDATGDPRAWSVLAWDFGGGLELREWAFESNFRLRLTVRAYADTPAGSWPISLTLQNNFGVFAASGEFFIFR